MLVYGRFFNYFQRKISLKDSLSGEFADREFAEEMKNW